MRTDILNLYKSRFGSAVKRQGNGWNGPCPLCGGEPGKSDRFMVWPDRAESLGEVCATHNITGIWSCRQCGASGDTIAYLMKIDDLDFKAALAELGIEGERLSHRRLRAPAEPRRADADRWIPREWSEPSEQWSAYAARLLAEAEENIWNQPAALNWLAARGLGKKAVRRYRIGYLPAESARYPGRYRARSALGLEPKTGVDGKVRTKLFIPRGIVIPTCAPDGRVINLRIRRHKEDLGEHSPKYLELDGSCKAPLLLRSSLPGPLAAYFVTEAELDAMLIHHATDGVVGALAVRTNRGKPDVSADGRLREAVCVCIALDYDEPGADGVEFWEKTYPAALRWPTPEGKDPGDACKLGVDIREWVAAALPPSIPLSGNKSESHRDRVSQYEITTQDICQNGQLGTSAAGQLEVGGGAEPETISSEKGSGPAGLSAHMRTRETDDAARIAWATAEDFTPDELCRLQAALPADMPLDLLPLDVARAYLLWRGIPASFSKFRNADGDSVGFSWDYDDAWRRKHSERFEAFWRFQDKSPALWEWMSDHPAMTITSQNLLHIWG